MVAVMVVESPAWLLGVKLVVVLPLEPVSAVVGFTLAVNPAAGGVVTEKVNGTPGWVVPSLAVMVTGEPPAVKVLTLAVTVVVVPLATSYAVHVGPAYDAGEEPASMSDVVKIPVGGAADTGDATEVEMPPR